MLVETLEYTEISWKFVEESIEDKNRVDLLLCFGDTDTFSDSAHYHYFHKLYPNAYIVGASSAGHLIGPQVSQATLVATAISFESSRVQCSSVELDAYANLEEASKALIAPFDDAGLKSLFIISDGLHVNGTLLADTLHKERPNTLITGGLAGDDARFERTFVMANGEPKEKQILALGFYGECLHTSSGCYAGWDEFGVERIITKSQDNILYEINDEPALQLYKRYLGDVVQELPASGLRFPLSIKKSEEDKSIIRSLLAVDEEKQSFIFAGDVPEGYIAKLMKTDIDGLIDGSANAAEAIVQTNSKDALGLVVSCVGRRLVMRDLTDEELEVIEENVGKNVHLTGFYSYGELAPFSDTLLDCKLHNQTMTFTVIYEN